MNIRTLFIFTLLITIASFIACNKESNNNPTTGKLKIHLTDAPFPTDLVAEANVTINKIEIRRANENEGEDSISPFITLSEEEMQFNLLDLTNGLTASLVDLEIEAGSYDLIRLYVTKSDVILKDGSGFDLKVPSGAKSGLKVFIKPNLVVTGGLTTELLLDFDVSKSFKAQGNPNDPSNIRGFIFKPVVKASNLSSTGTLTGVVTDTASSVLDGVQVSVMVADSVYTTSFTNESGQYTILGIDAGFYSVNYELKGYESIVEENVNITAANETRIDIQLVQN